MKRSILHCICLCTVSAICTTSLANELDNTVLGESPSQLDALMAPLVEPIVSEKAWSMSQASQSALLSVAVGETVKLTSFPLDAIRLDDSAAQAGVLLTRYEPFADGASVTLIDEQGARFLPRQPMRAFMDTQAGVGLVIDTSTGRVNGLYRRGGSLLSIEGNVNDQLSLRRTEVDARIDESINQCHASLADQPRSAQLGIAQAMGSITAAGSGGGLQFQTVIAVDTDNEWMAGKGNNTTTAMNFITAMFVNMNVIYEPDLDIRLLIGDVFLRISSDPFPTEPDISQYLTDFGEFWRTSQGAVDRDFALMLSGQNIQSSSFSGIAWINAYCANGQVFSNGMGGTVTFGSYSVNRIGTNLGAAFTAKGVGHEIGHNLGSPHTHCYTPEVDQCFNQEGGCYTGAVSCPGMGKGTIMSYCNFNTASGGANCGQTDAEFHPAVQGLIGGLINNNFPSCIDTFGDDGLIFEGGFE